MVCGQFNLCGFSREAIRGSTCDSPPARRGHGSLTLSNPHNQSSLQTVPSKQDRFWPINGAISQKNGGPMKFILHFFSHFPDFLGFFLLQAVDFKPQPPLQPLQKKSCQKHYRRFYVRSAICHNRCMNVEMTVWEQGCAGSVAFRRQPALTMKSDNPQRPSPSYRPHSSHPSHSSHSSFLVALIKPPGHQTQSNPIKPNQSQ